MVIEKRAGPESTEEEHMRARARRGFRSYLKKKKKNILKLPSKN